MDAILKKITGFADKAHGDQRRKYADEKYIEHPVRVMTICKGYDHSLPVLAAALLHDVLEDTDVTLHDIEDFLLTVMSAKDAGHTLDLVIELTDVYTKDKYPGMNRRERKLKETRRLENISSQAQTIKYADIIDNAKEMAEHDADFAPVFLRECRAIIQYMKKGHPGLRKQALETVSYELERL